MLLCRPLRSTLQRLSVPPFNFVGKTEARVVAVNMYEGLGYSVYRRVKGYYSGGVKEGEEDAFGEPSLFKADVD